MLSIIIVASLFVLNIIAMIISWRMDEGFEMCGVPLFFLTGIALAMMILGAITAPVEWEQFKAEYEYTKGIVETYHPYDYGNTADVTKRIFDINLEIARHKARYNNKFFDVWYSEEIANLEPLKFKTIEHEKSND